MNYFVNFVSKVKGSKVPVQASAHSHQGLLLGGLLSLLLLLPMSVFLVRQPVDVLVFLTPLIHSEHAAVKEVLSRFVPHRFWSTDVYDIADQIDALSWVNEVVVSKVWPNKLIIKIKSEQLVAKWNESGYINGDGKIVTSFRVPIQLPNIYSSPAKGEQAVEMLSEIERKLTPVARLKINDRGAVSIALENGIEINFGAEAFTTRLERIRQLLNSKARNGRKIERIDARYPYGLAVVWREGLGSPASGR